MVGSLSTIFVNDVVEWETEFMEQHESGVVAIGIILFSQPDWLDLFIM
jgi:hypothetical protein